MTWNFLLFLLLFSPPHSTEKHKWSLAKYNTPRTESDPNSLCPLRAPVKCQKQTIHRKWINGYFMMHVEKEILSSEWKKRDFYLFTNWNWLFKVFIEITIFHLFPCVFYLFHRVVFHAQNAQLIDWMSSLSEKADEQFVNLISFFFFSPSPLSLQHNRRFFIWWHILWLMSPSIAWFQLENRLTNEAHFGPLSINRE